ncbi:hypothetical protein HU200_036888 [Digitaria exilis]|uniref:E2 ubiquitin-conjugating enzyme n=1 Tax=Digitaria exilis TaxID=1010633 RepID=A0A835EMZ6_9POAL|nr:hypothetical protein HU200_036888 [Digitaria exilis]
MISGEKIQNHKNKQAVVDIDWPEQSKQLQSGMFAYFAGSSAIPVTMVGQSDVLGGYHNNVASPNAIPATNFYQLDMLAPYYYAQFNSSLMESEMPHQPSQTKIVNSEVDEKYETFKKFDTVNDNRDHFYSLPGKYKAHAVKKPSQAWVKRIQHEWKVLENDLPDAIYVRVYEDRMDLLRAVIVGPAGTPYHDGLFFFDVHFPSRYPSQPPLVNYRSGGLRLNPNLCSSGKVCLSLLNTWVGTGCEKWNPSNSTMLQVLVSIQALVLNANPYFNEPANFMDASTYHVERQYMESQSLKYNEQAFLLSCRTMQYSLRNPPKHFEDFIVGHFRNYGHKILKGCKSYMAGAQVGCLVGDGVQDVDEGDKSCSANFKASLKVLFADLLKEFANIGVDCVEFQNPGAAKATAGTSLT